MELSDKVKKNFKMVDGFNRPDLLVSVGQSVLQKIQTRDPLQNPLERGGSKKTVSKNIRMEMHAGKKQSQAIVIAMKSAGKSKMPMKKKAMMMKEKDMMMKGKK